VLVVAVCTTVIAAPIAAIAATAVFTSSSASTPAVTATNSSATSGAKAVYGNASASSGTVYGVYGHTSSGSGYGVYSAGRLGSSGPLVCSHCVTGGDVNAATFPTMPNASKLGGNAPSYYARIVPLSSVVPADNASHLLASVDGLEVFGWCDTSPRIRIFLAADTAGTVNYFDVSGSTATANGFGIAADTAEVVAASSGAQQTEGSAIYRSDTTGRIITINFHLFGAGCQLFGDVLTTG
jgi:hypothetical protein